MEYLARKGDGQMDQADLATVVKTAVSQSIQYVEAELSPDRAKATEYYGGKLFGNEEEGRSQVILTEVRDAVDGIVPDMLRVAMPPGEHAVEFVPSRAETVAQAEQQTDYVRYVFEQDNAGYLRTMDVVKDGLVRKIGIFKWGWDDSVSTKAFTQEGISIDDLKALAADDTVTLTKGGTTKRADGLYNVSLTRKDTEGRARVWSVPPEEFFYNREARSIGEALLVGHRTEKTRGQLLAMGVKAKDLEAHGQTTREVKTNMEETARRDIGAVGAGLSAGVGTDPELGKANDKITYTECWMTVDFDGDGIAELRRICTIGSDYYPVQNVPADERPFSIFTPYPEPHTLLGGSTADRTMDVQKITSSLMRGMLDSASLAIFPRMAYLDGQASVADIMNTAIGAPMRERVAGAIRPVVTPFTGKEMMPVLQFMQEVVERRTGKPKGAAGLDADALQSTGAEAVGAVLTGSQGQIEVMARVLAEMALKPLFMGLGRLLNTKQPKARVVRLRGQWVAVDPRTWDADLDVTVNVGLGSSFTEKKIATLMAVAADQKDILTNMGLTNPIVSLPMLVNTRMKILALQGLKDGQSYYNQLPADWQPPAPPQPQPSPEELWVQAEKEMAHQKTMKELAIKQDELMLKKMEMEWNHDFQLQKLASDIETKKYIADAANKVTASSTAVAQDIELQRHEAELALDGQAQLHDQHLARDQQEHDQSMAERAADTADTAAAQEPAA